MSDPMPANLEQVIVIGGGRWARVLADTLCNLLPSKAGIGIASPRGRNELAAWAAGRSPRLRVVGDREELRPAPKAAAIIANAAGDHVAAARWALARGLPTLVEKPFALHSGDARAVANEAHERAVLLAAANVFRYPRYLQNFATQLTALRAPEFIRINWVDERDEQRGGETKRFDPGVPVFADCLPHIVAILTSVFGGLPTLASSPEIYRAGMAVDLRLQLGKLPCHVHLERNGAARRRYISVAGSGSAIELDFSSEPGIIYKGADSLVADPDWNHAPRPLAEMLGSFLAAAAGAPADPRLDLGPALHACALSDSIRPAYLTQLGEWLSKALANRVSLDDELRYALSEILYGGRRLGEDELDEHFRRLHSAASGAPGSNELSFMIRSLTHRNGGKSTAESAAARD